MVQMHQQPNDLSDCQPKGNPAIGGRHFGPVMIYICEVPNAKASNGDCSWVKIAEDAYDNQSHKESSWGTVRYNDNKTQAMILTCTRKSSTTTAGKDLFQVSRLFADKHQTIADNRFAVPAGLKTGNYLIRAEA